MRKEAQIESMLQMIHYELSGGELSRGVPQLFGRLLDDVSKMLGLYQIEDATYAADCLTALDRLREAHKVRNRIVHDQWVMRQEVPGQYVAVSVPKGITGPEPVPDVKWGLTEFRECYEELRFCSVMISGIFWSIGNFVGDRPDIWREMVPSNRQAIAGRFKLVGENHWQFTDIAFVAQVNERMQRQAEAFRARLAQYYPDPIQDDGL